MQRAICFLTVRPSECLYRFAVQLNQSSDYDVYICIDDESYMGCENLQVPLIRVSRALCEEHGMKGTLLWRKDDACARDKALFYFLRVCEVRYPSIWFIEEDVFIPTLDAIRNIDDKYPSADLLSASHDVCTSRRSDWHWRHVFEQTTLDPPYASSMICAIRVSDRLLDCIDKYARAYNQLFLDEALFNTLALQAQLHVVTPPELSTIVWRRNWTFSDIKQSNLYHPIKDMRLHDQFRERFRVKR